MLEKSTACVSDIAAHLHERASVQHGIRLAPRGLNAAAYLAGESGSLSEACPKTYFHPCGVRA
jgi:hypothetical protein